MIYITLVVRFFWVNYHYFGLEGRAQQESSKTWTMAPIYFLRLHHPPEYGHNPYQCLVLYISWSLIKNMKRCASGISSTFGRLRQQGVLKCAGKKTTKLISNLYRIQISSKICTTSISYIKVLPNISPHNIILMFASPLSLIKEVIPHSIAFKISPKAFGKPQS